MAQVQSAAEAANYLHVRNDWLARRREEILEIPIGEASGVRGLAQLIERVPALAQARDDARVRNRGGRPPPVAERHDAAVDPAPERRRRHVQPACDIAEAQVRHDPEDESGGTAVVVPPPAGNAARCLGRRRSSEGDALRATKRPPTSRPIAWFGCRTF